MTPADQGRAHQDRQYRVLVDSTSGEVLLCYSTNGNTHTLRIMAVVVDETEATVLRRALQPENGGKG